VNPITNISPDAVKVTARRDSGSSNGPITTFFANIFGINTVDVSAVAVAALTGQSSAGPGGLPIPIAINKSWVANPANCKENLTFHPSSASTCSAWHSYTSDSYDPNANDIRNMIYALAAEPPTYSSPQTIAGETEYDVTNGSLSSLFTSDAIQTLFNAMKVKDDGFYDMEDENTPPMKDSNGNIMLDEDGTSYTHEKTWTSSVPVFDDTEVGCSPVQSLPIVGFATIRIYKVLTPSTSTVYAQLQCDSFKTGRSGGGSYGTKGTIPALVK